MTELLERAIAQLQTLPPNAQNAADRHSASLIATMILEELEDETRWDEAFARSSNVLAQLAAEAMTEYHAGKTIEILDVR
jgi:hypothetical protein